MAVLMKKITSVLVFALLLLRASPSAASEQVGPYEWTGVERLVVIGDVHGSYDKLLPLLKGTNLVDDDLIWIGRESHLLFLGDLIDRGPLEKMVLDLVSRLEGEAKAAGGGIHIVLGNHEVLNIIGDLRFVKGRGFSDFADLEQAADRRAALGRFRGAPYNVGMSSGEVAAAFNETHPEGYFGRLRAFAPDGIYGKWLMEKPAVVKLNGYLFLHGGLTDDVAGLGLDAINETVHENIRDYIANRELLADGKLFNYNEARDAAEALAGNRAAQRRDPARAAAAAAIVDHFDGLAFSPGGPLWYRGNSVENEQVERASLERVLVLLDARGLMVAHTPTSTGRISSRFGGRVIRADVGMAYGRAPLCIVVQNQRVVAYDPRRQGFLSHIIEATQGQRWSDIQEQLPDEQMERFLQRAKVVDRLLVEREGRKGEVLSLKNRKLELRSVFLTVDEAPGSDPKAPVRRWTHEVASYRLDRLMGLGLVPVTVERKLGDEIGSLQIWMQAAIDSSQIEELGAEELLEGLENELMQARIFMSLIGGGRDRADFGKMLLPEERRLALADNTKTFPLKTELEELPEECRVGAEFRLGMNRLSASSLKKEVGDHLSGAQIKALLARRDAILKACA
jgi:hypothetical protein